jgi:hypothetical protein
LNALKEAVDNHVLAERWQQGCLQLLGRQRPAKAAPCKKARVLLHGLGRGRALISSAMAWEEPNLGPNRRSETNMMRGQLWRYLMAYTGWELIAKSVVWDGSNPGGLQPEHFMALLNGAPLLKPPFAAIEDAPRPLQTWLAADDGEEAHLPAFLGLTSNHCKFMDWLVSKPCGLNDLQVLACMRHVVAHGTLSPTKALQWGLNDLYASAPGLLGNLAERLIHGITPNR